MTSLSVVWPSLAFCLLTLVGIGFSWKLQDQSRSALPNFRLGLFRFGALVGGIGLIVTAISFLDPFALVQHPDGSMSVSPWLGRTWTTGFLAALVTTLLALFGRGKARVLLCASGMLSGLLTFAAVLQNGV